MGENRTQTFRQVGTLKAVCEAKLPKKDSKKCQRIEKNVLAASEEGEER